MSQLNQYVGLDVSLKETSISVIDEADKTIWRGRSASTPDDIAEKLSARAPHAQRIGLECGQLSNWLYHGLKSKGLPVICIDARHASATLSLRINKTDTNDAQGLAQLMRVGWYRETTVKGIDTRYVRSLLVVRQRLVFQITALKNCIRGVIKGFGRVMPKALKRRFVPKIREAVANNTLLAALIEPTLRALEAAMEQLFVYDRAVAKQARDDQTVRLLMTAPGVGPIVALAYVTGVEEPARFSSSASVGAYFGMTPRRYQSGEVDLARRVSKCGDGMVRGLLFEAAKVLLSRTCRPCALQKWGQALARKIGGKKATMAVARKLAVILHRMWSTGRPFQWNDASAEAA
ncbi:MAG: IS110 family transposase [Pseudolabrys sp.]